MKKAFVGISAVLFVIGGLAYGGSSSCGLVKYDSNDIINKYIPDNNPTGHNSTLVIADSNTIADVNVMLNITHTWDEDLDVFLIAPDSTRIELFTDVGGRYDNFTNTIIDDSAAAAIPSGTAPFSGSYRPEGNLAALNGMSTAGTWKLEIKDDSPSDTGRLYSWSLIIAHCPDGYIPGDLDGDGDVDIDDFVILIDQWLAEPGEPSADIAPLPDGDGWVDLLDFALLAQDWLE